MVGNLNLAARHQRGLYRREAVIVTVDGTGLIGTVIFRRGLKRGRFSREQINIIVAETTQTTAIIWQVLCEPFPISESHFHNQRSQTLLSISNNTPHALAVPYASAGSAVKSRQRPWINQAVHYASLGSAIWKPRKCPMQTLAVPL